MNQLISIVGPTAIGKTNFAVGLAKKFDAEIISADSRQFYKEMTIGTAKPTRSEMKGIVHHFVDFLGVDENYSAGKFEEQAIAKIEKLHRSNPLVIMVGGSGLYVDAVLKGIDPIPSNPEIRIALQKELSQNGIEKLQNELLQRDPQHHMFMDINNPQRLVRALEVCRHTGKTYTSFRKRVAKSRPFEVIKIGMTANREEIYKRINQRVDQMISAGLLDEVKSLTTVKNLNALQTVGYKELFEYLDDTTDLATAIENIKRNTRRFAKRQMTWFNKDSEIQWFDIEQLDAAISFVTASIHTS